MDATSRLVSSAVSLLVCAFVLCVFESLFNSVLGVVLPTGYMALNLGLTALVALGAAVLAALPGASLALSLGVFSGCVIAIPLELWAAVVGGIGVWGLARSGLRAQVPGVLIGAGVGVSLPLSLLVWPRMAERSGLDALSRGEGATAALLLVLFLSIGFILAASTLRNRPKLSWIPVAAILLAAATSMTPLLTRFSHEEFNLPQFEGQADAPEAASVIILILDTVRADHLSVYGYHRDTTPQLAQLLSDRPEVGLYQMAFAPGTWTLPSHASLFTGLLSSQHNAHEGTMFTLDSVRKPRLNAPETLAELARKNDYRTALILSNSVLLRADGMERGFDWVVKPKQAFRYQLLGERLTRSLLPMAYDYVDKGGPTASRITDVILRFIDSVGDSPFLIVGNYSDAHIPYAARPPFSGAYTDEQIPNWGPPKYGQPPELIEYLKGRYDEEILSLDSSLGELFQQLEKRGVLDRSWLIITSDHGEAFGEHGITEHGTTVYNEVTRIPLIISPPQSEKLIPTQDAVSLIDVTAMVSLIVGGSKLGVGRDLREVDEQSVVQIEYFGNPRKLNHHGPLAAQSGRAVAIGDQKLLTQGDRTELYSLSDDPLEEHDRYEELSASAAVLGAALPELLMDEASRTEEEFSEEETAELRALGYIE